MAVPDTSSASSKYYPRFTLSAECRRPAPDAPLTDQQISALNTLRTQIHTAVAKTEAQRRWADDRCLLRYLKARRWNINDTKQAIQDSIQWREDFKPDIPDKESLWVETEPGKLYVSGFDMESRPLLYMKPRLENTTASIRQIRHVVFHLETAIALMPEGVQNLCIIIDFAGSSMTKNPGVGIAREIIHVLGSHYPERLGKAYIINAPWFFFPFYKLISPFIDPVTKAKINFVDMKKQKPKSTVISTPSSATASETDLSSTTTSTKTSPFKKISSVSHPTSSSSSSSSVSDNVNLLDVIPEDMLEQAFGGSSSYEYNQEIYWNEASRVLAEARSNLEQGAPVAAIAPDTKPNTDS